MAVSTTNAYSGPYLTNGVTTVFPFTFTAPTAAEVGVFLRSADGEEAAASGYSVALTDGGGGSVTFANAPAAGASLYILLDPYFTQDLEFENGSAWIAEPVNEGYDRSASRDQVLKRDTDRGVKVPIGEAGITFPAVASRANGFLVFLPDGSIGISAGTGNDPALRQDLGSSGSGKGSELVNFKQSGVGAIARTALDKMREIISVKDFGAVGDGVTNDYAAVQLATTYGMSRQWGCTVHFPPGIYKIVGTVTQDRSNNSALGVVNYDGAGRLATTIYHSGATTLFSATGHPTEIGKQTTDIRVSGMTILGEGTVGSVAIGHTLCSDPHYEDLHIEGFDYAFYLQDVDQAVFGACMIQFNRHGLFARQNPLGPAVVPNCTHPNQFVFNGVTWLNNGYFGLHGVGGSNWTFIGGVISTNGQSDSVNGFGIKIEDGGYQGGNLLTMIGTNFESNNGLADVILVQITASSAATQATYAFYGVSFNRTSNTIRATNVILTNFASAATVGEQRVTLESCVFKSLGEYTPSAGRPYLNWSGVQSRNARNFSAPGTIFEDAVEAPSFVQNITKPFVEISKSANQSIPNNTPTVWQLDTVGNGFSWTPTINGSFQQPIADAGNYQISVTLTFSLPLANQTLVEIMKNGLTLSAGTGTNVSVVSASTTKYCAAGDLISIRVTQLSGGAATLVGSASAISFVNIQKLMDA